MCEVPAAAAPCDRRNRGRHCRASRRDLEITEVPEVSRSERRSPADGRACATGLRLCIHRGTQEIGGSCIEVEARDARVLVDLGLPLDRSGGLPQVRGLETAGDASLLGVVVSHAHLDHYGLLSRVRRDLPVYIGEAGSRILSEAAFFSPAGITLKPMAFLRDREPLQIGPFEITPFLVDHSAYDSYALLIEADGRRVLYSGDLRAHGRKPGTFARLLRQPPHNVDVLLLEGTRITADGGDTHGSLSERGLELALAEKFRSTTGLAVVLAAAQNIDRLVTTYRAARRSGRTLVTDLYTATLAEATGRATIPHPAAHDLRVYVPNRQRVLVKRTGEFERTRGVAPYRIYLDELAARRSTFTMLAQPSTLPELARAGCLQGAHAVWSMWTGYLDEPSGRAARALLKRERVPLDRLHSSGHAAPDDLRRLVQAINARRTIPIHTSAPERARQAFGSQVAIADGEWITC
jgi:ribonuclease J